MRVSILVIILFFVLLPQISSASIYRCEINGETVFSQVPCSADAEELDVRTSSPGQNSTPAESDNTAPDAGKEPPVDEGPSYAEQKRQEREIRGLEKERKKLLASRDKEIDKINKAIRETNDRDKSGKLQLKAMDVQGDYNRRITDVSKKISQLKAGK